MEAVCEGREQEVATLVASGVDVESTYGPDGNYHIIVIKQKDWRRYTQVQWFCIHVQDMFCAFSLC